MRQAIAAFVTVKQGVEASDALKNEIKTHVARKIGALARPDDVIFAADLPKTRSGKIMRRLLRDIAEGKALGERMRRRDELTGAKCAPLVHPQQRIARELSVDRFFRNIRPYFKPHRVGDVVHRGVNAGDFSAINEIDVLLGLCDPGDPFYASIVAEKIPFVPPDEQRALRELDGAGALLARYEAEAENGVTAQLHDNARRFLAVCRAHGHAYAFHHTALVKPFLERPAADAPPDRVAELSASGPPLHEVIATLDRLRVLRTDRAPLEGLRNLIE